MLSAFQPEFEQAGVKLVALTHQDESEIRSFMQAGYWKGELYRDRSGACYKSLGATVGSAGGWTFLRSMTKGFNKMSKDFKSSLGQVKGNLKGVSLKASAMLLVKPSSPDAAPLFFQPFAEEPAIGKIFAALGADEKRAQQLDASAREEMKRIAAKRAAEEEPSTSSFSEDQARVEDCD